MKNTKFPSKYYSGLSQKNTKKQLKALKTSIKSYKKGKYVSRPKLPSFESLQSPHVKKFTKLYGVKITELNKVSKATGVPKDALDKIINKGMGAYYSSGSRPNQNPWSWGYARLASVLTYGKSYNRDKHVLEDYGVSSIKKPRKKTKRKIRGA